MQNAKTPDPNNQKFTHTFLIVIAAFTIMATFGGTRFSFGVFFKPIMNDLGWTRAITSGAFSLNGLISGFAGLLLGQMTDRLGPRIVLTIIGVFLGIGYLLMSQIGQIWQLYLFYGVIIGIGNSVHVPVISSIAKKFQTKRGLMTGIVMAGVGAGQLLIPLATAVLIDTCYWRTSLLIFGIVALLIMTTASQFMKIHQGKDIAASRGEKGLQTMGPDTNRLSLKDVARTEHFWLIIAIHFFLSYCVQAISVHIVPYATDLGISPTMAASVLSVIGGTLIAARIIMGNAVDKIGEAKVFMIGFLLLLISLIGIFFIKEVWMFYLLAILVGFSYSTSLAGSTIIAKIYGLKSHATIFSIATFAYTMGIVTGPSIFGYLHDLTNSYQQAFLSAVIIAGLGFLFASVLLLHKPKFN